MPTSAERLAREIATLRRRLTSVERVSAMSRRSVENGSIKVFGPDGAVRGLVGLQPDGSTAFTTRNDPKPAMPSAPILEPIAGGLLITWDGTFFGGVAAPSDLASIEIHASTSAVYTPSTTTLRGRLSRDANSFSANLPADPYNVIFVAVTTGGSRSEPSVIATETPSVVLTDADRAALEAAAAQAQADATAAQAAADTALTTANGKNTVTYSTAVASGSGKRAGDIWFQRDTAGVIIASWEWTGSAWAARTYGDGVLNSLTVGKLVSGEIAAGQRIIAGPANGTHAEMSSTGFRVYAADSVDGVPNEVIRLGTSTDDYFAIVGEGGVLNASVDGTGMGSFSALNSTRWPEISAADHTGRGGTLLEILDRRPRGLVAWGSDFGTYDSNTSAGRGIFDITAKLYKGRMYRINVRCRINAQVANDALAEIQVRWTSSATYGDLYNTAGDPPVPDINSPIAGRYDASTSRPEAQSVYFEKPFSLGPGSADAYLNTRFLLCLSRPVGGTTLTMWGPQPDGIEMWIEDIGPYIVPTVTLNNGGGGVAAPAPAYQAQRYNRTWVCNWHQNWRGNNSFVDLPGAYQGLDPSGNNGNMRSYLGFSGVDLEGSEQTMDQALSGAIVEDVGLFLYASHWYYNSGGEGIIGMHGYRDPVGAWGGGNEWMFGGTNWPKPGGLWVSLGGISPQNWTNGTWKGILLGGVDAGQIAHYGRFDAEGSAQLNITYRK